MRLEGFGVEHLTETKGQSGRMVHAWFPKGRDLRIITGLIVLQEKTPDAGGDVPLRLAFLPVLALRL